MHTWLPDAHSESPAPVSAMLSGALLNTAMLGVVRFLAVVDAAHIGLLPRLRDGRPRPAVGADRRAIHRPPARGQAADGLFERRAHGRDGPRLRLRRRARRRRRALPHAQPLAEQVADVLRRRQRHARLRDEADRAAFATSPAVCRRKASSGSPVPRRSPARRPSGCSRASFCHPARRACASPMLGPSGRWRCCWSSSSSVFSITSASCLPATKAAEGRPATKLSAWCVTPMWLAVVPLPDPRPVVAAAVLELFPGDRPGLAGAAMSDGRTRIRQQRVGARRQGARDESPGIAVEARRRRRTRRQGEGVCTRPAGGCRWPMPGGRSRARSRCATSKRAGEPQFPDLGLPAGRRAFPASATYFRCSAGTSGRSPTSSDLIFDDHPEPQRLVLQEGASLPAPPFDPSFPDGGASGRKARAAPVARARRPRAGRSGASLRPGARRRRRVRRIPLLLRR